MIGHVTSSYASPTLGRSIALALVKSGRARIGQTVHASPGTRFLPCKVTEPAFYDPEGAKRDG